MFVRNDTESEMSTWGQYDLTREFVSNYLVKLRDHYSVEWDTATNLAGLKHPIMVDVLGPPWS